MTLQVSRKMLSGYPALLSRVRETLIDGQRRLEAERVRAYWETCKHNCQPLNPRTH